MQNKSAKTQSDAKSVCFVASTLWNNLSKHLHTEDSCGLFVHERKTVYMGLFVRDTSENVSLKGALQINLLT